MTPEPSAKGPTCQQWALTAPITRARAAGADAIAIEDGEEHAEVEVEAILDDGMGEDGAFVDDDFDVGHHLDEVTSSLIQMVANIEII